MVLLGKDSKEYRARDELWLACAGEVEIPCPGQLVFYFPQGHIEQVCSIYNIYSLFPLIFFFLFYFYIYIYI